MEESGLETENYTSFRESEKKNERKKKPGERSGDRGGGMKGLKGSVAERGVVPGNQEAGDLAGKMKLDTN